MRRREMAEQQEEEEEEEEMFAERKKRRKRFQRSWKRRSQPRRGEITRPDSFLTEKKFFAAKTLPSIGKEHTLETSKCAF